jgi:hypothetical protein
MPTTTLAQDIHTLVRARITQPGGDQGLLSVALGQAEISLPQIVGAELRQHATPAERVRFLANDALKKLEKQSTALEGFNGLQAIAADRLTIAIVIEAISRSTSEQFHFNHPQHSMREGSLRALIVAADIIAPHLNSQDRQRLAAMCDKPAPHCYEAYAKGPVLVALAGACTNPNVEAVAQAIYADGNSSGALRKHTIETLYNSKNAETRASFYRKMFSHHWSVGERELQDVVQVLELGGPAAADQGAIRAFAWGGTRYKTDILESCNRGRIGRVMFMCELIVSIVDPAYYPSTLIARGLLSKCDPDSNKWFNRQLDRFEEWSKIVRRK